MPLPDLISIGFCFAGHIKLPIKYNQKYVTLCFKMLFAFHLTSFHKEFKLLKMCFHPLVPNTILGKK